MHGDRHCSMAFSVPGLAENGMQGSLPPVSFQHWTATALVGQQGLFCMAAKPRGKIQL